MVSTISEQTAEELRLYVDMGTPPSRWLRAVLSNDLAGAVRYARSHQRYDLVGVVLAMWDELPPTCWGSPSRVDEYVREMAKRRELAVTAELERF